MDAADDALLDDLQRAAFDYFVTQADPETGLVADTSRPDSHTSIAVVGFALSAYPVGVERGWMPRQQAVQRSLAALRFFMHSDQTGAPDSTGCQGLYFHFLHRDSGQRAWQSELSLIDSALLIAGMLTAAAYFTGPDQDETELRALADTLYRRVNWRWAQPDGAAVAQGWRPESGFLHYGWQGYSEAILLYVLGLGSPTHALADSSFDAWTMTYQWENLYGVDYLYAGPLFIHQYSHAWIDFRGIRDRFMREKRCDYFENSRRAIQVQREYAIRNPHHFNGYDEDHWGLSASDGPSSPPQTVCGRHQAFYGYAARGTPWGPDDGTQSPAALLASIPFAPDIVLRAVRKRLEDMSVSPRADGANATVRGAWVADCEFGLDQGMIVLMAENLRSGMIWRLLRGVPYVRTGLRRAGFRGGWLARERAS